MRLTLIAAAAIAFMATSSAAVAEQSWSHKAWSVTKEGETCTLRTGGDGDGVFTLTFESGKGAFKAIPGSGGMIQLRAA